MIEWRNFSHTSCEWLDRWSEDILCHKLYKNWSLFPYDDEYGRLNYFVMCTLVRKSNKDTFVCFRLAIGLKKYFHNCWHRDDFSYGFWNGWYVSFVFLSNERENELQSAVFLTIFHLFTQKNRYQYEPQTVHWNVVSFGFAFIWINLCRFRLFDFANDLLQIWHICWSGGCSGVFFALSSTGSISLSLRIDL